MTGRFFQKAHGVRYGPDPLNRQEDCLTENRCESEMGAGRACLWPRCAVSSIASDRVPSTR